MKKLSKRIIGILEDNDFGVCSIDEQGGEYCAEIETYSPAGEDVIVSLWYDGTSKDFVRAFVEYADDFDPDEHAEMWVDHRGEGGCPSSIRELIDDADAIKNTLMRVAEKLSA